VSCPDVTPLTEPPLPVTPPSRFERACWFVPILGWLIAAFLETRRRTPKARHIAAQIRDRKRPIHDAWGDHADRRATAVVVCQEIQREFDWPNDHYLPADPLRLLIWRTRQDVELLFALFEVGRRLGIRAVPAADFDYANATLGDLVDRIVRGGNVGRSLPCNGAM
jgi:hypothetical protein